jgi:hypothetical protein
VGNIGGRRKRAGTPLNTRLSSTRGFPWDFGKKGSSLAICASLSQQRSLNARSVFGAVNHAARQKLVHPDARKQKGMSLNRQQSDQIAVQPHCIAILAFFLMVRM